MNKLEKLKIFYEFMDFITNYDYSDCDNFNDFVSKIFSQVMQELDEEEKRNIKLNTLTY